MAEFRVLGPVEASLDGEPIALPAAKPRALLAALLLDRNRVVPVSRLIDDSVVVLENIFRHMEMGKEAAMAAENGGEEVALPILAATCTTAIVFFPVVFLYGVSRFLFVALALTVVTVLEDQSTTEATLARARSYLESHGVQATYRIEQGAVGEAILATAAASSSDLIVIGGYGFNPLLEIVLGSTVDQVLRASRLPVLICR